MIRPPSLASANLACPPHFLDEVRSRTSLERLVAGHVTLKRSGSGLRGPCPIHGSGKASISFSVRNGRYRCFACGEHGDVIGFVMWADRLTFPEAVRRLAHDAGLAVPSEISSAPPDAAVEAQRHRQIEERRARHEAKQASERAADIAAALAYWRASVPLDGTLGEQYLSATRKIEKPAADWSASLRYRPRVFFPPRARSACAREATAPAAPPGRFPSRGRIAKSPMRRAPSGR